nr:TPA_inf: hormone Insulin-related peptide [Conus judaeus]
MMSSSYFLLVTLGLLLYVCQSSIGNERTCEPEDPADPQGKCGSELSEYHERMCELEEIRHGGTFDPDKKRGRASPLRKRRGFLSMLKARAKRNEAGSLQRAGRGIICECCQNRCSDEEFTEYWPPVTES